MHKYEFANLASMENRRKQKHVKMERIIKDPVVEAEK